MQNNNTVRVRIVKCSDIMYWYKDSIGTEYNVIESDDYSNCWIVMSKNNFGQTSILKLDCEVISSPEASQHPDEIKRKGIDAFDSSMQRTFKEALEQGKEERQVPNAKKAAEILDRKYEKGMHWKTVNRFNVIAAMLEFADYESKSSNSQPLIQENGKLTLKYQVADAFGDWKDVTYDIYDEYPSSHPRRIITLRNGEEVHPEDYCQRCGGKNVVWTSHNEMYNKINGSSDGIICPQCFAESAKKLGLSIIFRADDIIEQNPEVFCKEKVPMNSFEENLWRDF